MKYYYLVARYLIDDLTMDENTVLMGPYNTVAERSHAIAVDMGNRDLETSEIVNITLLHVVDGELKSSRSYFADEN